MRSYHAIVTALCKAERWPLPVAEYRFAPPRRWRFDLCWPAHFLAAEIQGGLFLAGRHVRGASLIAEYQKLNEASVLGWVVLLVLPAQITDGTLSTLLGRYFTRLWPSQFGTHANKQRDEVR